MDSKTNDQVISIDHVEEEERKRIFNYCRNHLQGAWRDLESHDEIAITRLCGGMTNMLFRCALTNGKNGNLETEQDDNDGPREVLLRLYGQSHGDTEIELEIFKRLAGERLGPSLLSSFTEGRFEQYLPSNPLSWSEMTDLSISNVVARKIALIHKLNIKCLDREPTWLMEKYNHDYAYIERIRKQQIPLTFRPDTLESTKRIAENLLKIDFKAEIEYLDAIFRRSNSELVVSHNDLHQNNILLLFHDEDSNHSNDDLNNRVVLIDFEYCSYNYRPFDLANHLAEWCFDYTGDEYPFFNASLDRFPSIVRQKQFLKTYLEELDDTDVSSPKTGNNNENYKSNNCDNSNGISKVSDARVEALFDEMQPFLMAANLLWALWAIRQACTSEIKFGYWEMAKMKWDCYLYCKSNSRPGHL